MNIEGLKIGFALTGSFCTIEDTLKEITNLNKKGAKVFPIVSENVANFDTRFTCAKELLEKLESITDNRVIDSIVKAEPIGPKSFLDILVVAPCTGNTLSKIANGITDTTVTMSVKAHLRNEKPVVIAVSSNDALGTTGKNLGLLLNTRNIYFVPFYQDNPYDKARSIVAKNDLIFETIVKAMSGKQIQPLLKEYTAL